MARLINILQRGRVQIWLAAFLPALLLVSVIVIVVRFWAMQRLVEPLGDRSAAFVDLAFPWWLTLLVIVVCACCTSGLSYMMLARIIGVVGGLRELAGQLSLGNYTARLTNLPAHLPVETKEFVQSMNRLAYALQGHERMRRDLLTNLAHELRTPLTNLQGYLEGMRDGVIQADEEAIASLHEESLRLSRLVDGLHQIAHAEALTFRRLELRPVPLDALVSQLLETLAATAAQKEIEVVVRLETGDASVPVHTEAMMQVMRTLLQNAHQYTEPGGWVRIDTRVEDASYKLRCANGPSKVSPEDVTYLFHRFYRGENAVHEYGVGLGLPIARELVQAHGGTLAACILGGQFAIEMTVPLGCRDM